MEILNPITDTAYSDRVNSVAGQLADMLGKRVGGGRVQLGLVTFEDFARTIIKSKKGYDKKAKSEWIGQSIALRRIFAEYGWALFDKAILIAVVRKWAVDPTDGFIPLACGSMDIEAGLNIVADLHKECVVSGEPVDPDPIFAKAISEKVGITTEYGNLGDSLELVVPLYTPGIWRSISDTEFGRKTGAIIITPTLELYCEGMNINGLQPVQDKLLSGKVVEAMKIAKQLCAECNIA